MIYRKNSILKIQNNVFFSYIFKSPYVSPSSEDASISFLKIALSFSPVFKASFLPQPIFKLQCVLKACKVLYLMSLYFKLSSFEMTSDTGNNECDGILIMAELDLWQLYTWDGISIFDCCNFVLFEGSAGFSGAF